METSNWEVIQLELKYCERCGGLWLRRKGAGTVYCAACAEEMPEYPLRRRVRTRPRLPVNQRRGVAGEFDVFRMLDGEGGNA